MLGAAARLGRSTCTFATSSGSLITASNRFKHVKLPAAMAAADGQIRLPVLWTERVTKGTEDTGIRVLHLNKPETLNSLTPEMADLFRSELQQLESDTDMRALIVTGEGRAFSAGGDYQFIEDRMAGTVEDNAKVLASFYKTFLSIRKLPVVTIAAINGAAVGGGMGFAMACDLRIASSSAKLSYNFVKLGITPGMASTAILPSLTSHQVACRLLLTGDLITAQEALRLGLVLDVVESHQLITAATDLAARIAAAAPAAVSATLQMLRLQLPWNQLVAAAELEAQEQAAYFKGPDIREGLAAVREKRPPRFTSHATIDPVLEEQHSCGR